MDAVDSSRTSADARSHFVAASTQLPSIPVHVPAPTTAPTVVYWAAMSPVTHDGYQAYLWKWTNYFGGWQQRRRVMLRCRVVGWFILKDGTLTYYKDANTTDTGCRGSFKLEACNILVHPVDVLRFDILTSTQRIYLRANSKPGRQKWIIHLGSTKANISEEMPDVTTVTLSSFNEHKSELRTIRALLSDKVDEYLTLCNKSEPDAEQMKLCRAMINELSGLSRRI
eukprot:sb/3479487/